MVLHESQMPASLFQLFPFLPDPHLKKAFHTSTRTHTHTHTHTFTCNKAMSRDILHHHIRGQVLCASTEEARETTRHPTIPHRPNQKQLFGTKMSLVLRFRNPVLATS